MLSFVVELLFCCVEVSGVVVLSLCVVLCWVVLSMCCVACCVVLLCVWSCCVLCVVSLKIIWSSIASSGKANAL